MYFELKYITHKIFADRDYSYDVAIWSKGNSLGSFMLWFVIEKVY